MGSAVAHNPFREVPGMKARIDLIAAVLRVGVWLIVAAWCAVPVVWYASLAISNAGRPAAVAAPAPAMMPPPVDPWTMPRLPTGLAIMVTLFVYAGWCAAGCLCGQGADRAIVSMSSAAGLVWNRVGEGTK